jgi:hypothetical protein
MTAGADGVQQASLAHACASALDEWWVLFTASRSKSLPPLQTL